MTEKDSDLRMNKLCAICGDKALGTNFSVMSCESCKAFFRRNSLREHLITCPFQGHCIININSRKNCQYCRLKKCLSQGMKKDTLIKEAEKKVISEDCNSDMTSTDSGSPINYHVSKRGRKRLSKDNEDSGSEDDNVTIPKSEYYKMVGKIKTFEDSFLKKPTSCICTCSCGFYDKNTKLFSYNDALKQSSQQSKPKKEKIEFQTPIPPTQIPTTNNSHMLISPSIPNISNHSLLLYPQINSIPQINSNIPTQQFNLEQYQNYMSKAMNTNVFSMTPQQAFPKNVMLSSESTPGSSNMSTMSPYGSTSSYSPAISMYTIPSPAIQQHQNQPAIIDSDFCDGMEAFETILIEELLESNQILKEPIDVNSHDQVKDLSMNAIISITNTAFRRVIEMSKKLRLFQDLYQPDRMSLIKGGAGDLLILRGVMAYDSKAGMWSHSSSQGLADMQVKIDILKCSPEATYYIKHRAYLESFPERWRNNETIMLLLNAVTLFNPKRSNIQDIPKVHNANSIYSRILRKLLFVECKNKYETLNQFESLMTKLTDLEKLNDGMVSIYNLSNRSQLDPLLIELFNLKE